MKTKTLAEEHNFTSGTRFRVKSFLLRKKRSIQNLFSPVKKFSDRGKLREMPVIAVSESELWNSHDNDQNRILTAGKIENLRIAARTLNGVEVKANEIFSFWKHMGNPNFGKGYVIGREIREGCIVPTIAGGLCQLSNALYDAALKAGFEIVERHKHTRIIKGSLAEQDRDATVKWNYIDLRFKSTRAFRIEIVLTSSKLIVQFKSVAKGSADKEIESKKFQPSAINDCYSCGNTACFRHPGTTPLMHQKKTTTFILDEQWPEHDQYIASIASDNDRFIVPLKKNRFIKTGRYTWRSAREKNTKATTVPAILRAIRLRMAGKNTNLFSLSIRMDEKIAKKAARLIPLDSTHLVVSQNLLPFLWEQGAMGGRTFEVLMNRLPLQKLHERLDLAHARHPQSKTLNDFRASSKLVQLENTALNHAEKIITPHTEMAAFFKHKAIVPGWNQAENLPLSKGKKVLFPASPVGRKGAYEMKTLAKEWEIELVVAGKNQEQENFWEEVITHPFKGLDEIGLVIYPAYIEQQPRLLLRALAKGIPVIATTACGLPPMENLILVPVGDEKKLREAVTEQMHRMKVYKVQPEKVFLV